jgi:hypothetical protein
MTAFCGRERSGVPGEPGFGSLGAEALSEVEGPQRSS